jgi:hypothetical protein
MYFLPYVVAGVLPLCMAAPVSDSISMTAAVPEWTIESLTRVCHPSNTFCSWNFNVNTHLAPATVCSFTVQAQPPKPASHSDGSGFVCGPYTISSGWSGQFGPENGFTTLSIVDWSKRLIVWPAYTDKQVAGGTAVAPDQSYAPQTLP